MSRGSDVLVFGRDYARAAPGAAEVRQIATAIWTVRAGKTERAELFSNRGEALRAVGLPE